MFDKLEIKKEYPTYFIATRKYNPRPVAFIPKLKLKSDVFTVSETYKIVSFEFDK